MRLVLLPAIAGLCLLAACGQPAAEGEGAGGAVSSLKGAAVEHASAAASAAMSLVDTRTACLAVGQSPVTCDCIAGELGNELDGQVMEALTGVLKSAVDGQAGAAAEAAEGVDPATTQALVRCGILGAVAGG